MICTVSFLLGKILLSDIFPLTSIYPGSNEVHITHAHENQSRYEASSSQVQGNALSILLACNYPYYYITILLPRLPPIRES